MKTCAWAMSALLLMSSVAVKNTFPDETTGSFVLSHESLRGYVQQFNAHDEELYANIPNDEAFRFLKQNVPLFECPDTHFERTWYFRWWTYRKHVKETPDGYVVTEFLPDVPWSGTHNTISCPAGHHFYEGRWLHNPEYLDQYALFWLRGGGNPRLYSFWIADALLARHFVSPNPEWLVGLLDDLVANYGEWETRNRGNEALFYQSDDRDGMELSIGGSGYRATINSYMYGDARAIARIARLAGREDVSREFDHRADDIRDGVLSILWDEEARFFKVLHRDRDEREDVRELHGFTPWYFRLPPDGKGYERAWEQLMDPDGFYAPYGPTTAEQRHPQFRISYEGHECQWNGPSWPMATSITLTALANLLNHYDQDVITRQDYFETLRIYTRSHTRTTEDGTVVPWIDENLNPYTGDWIARTRLKTWNNGTWSAAKGGRERGKDYNHSTYNDLIITGLVGLRPRPDNVLEVNPLLPENTWDSFCLDHLRYRDRMLTIIWDKTGERYGKGQGLSIFVNGECIAQSETLSRITASLR